MKSEKCADCKRKGKIFDLLTKTWWCARCWKLVLKDMRSGRKKKA